MHMYSVSRETGGTYDLSRVAYQARSWIERRPDGTVAVGKVGYADPSVICAGECAAYSLLCAEARMYGEDA